MVNEKNLLSKLFLELIIVGKLGADVLSHLVFFLLSIQHLESQFGLENSTVSVFIFGN